jgi:hypothetical protein
MQKLARILLVFAALAICYSNVPAQKPGNTEGLPETVDELRSKSTFVEAVHTSHFSINLTNMGVVQIANSVTENLPSVSPVPTTGCWRY